MVSKFAVIACGDRNWKNQDRINSVLYDLMPDLLIHGACEGADMMAEKWANETETDFESYPYLKQYGNAGGPIRNKQMLDRLLVLQSECYHVRVIAFHPDIEKSKGTKNMVGIARKAGVPVEVYT